MLISTFELLLKPQLPKGLTDKYPKFSEITRNILQGYFLTIANVTNAPVSLSLVFTSTTPKLDLDDIVAFLDINGTNEIKKPTEPFDKDGDVKKSYFTIDLEANDTALFILQPRIAPKKDNPLKDANFELRGYVEILINPKSTQNKTKLLITPEHRGTFFDGDNFEPGNNTKPGDKSELGEVAYALPTANGSSLFKLRKDV